MKIKNQLIAALSAIIITFSAVAASPGNDRKIEEKAKASYNYQTVLDNKVTIKADDGVVTLSGVVQDKSLKSLAEDTVTNLPGVTRVHNNITVDTTIDERSDSWIAWKVRYQLLVHSNVSYMNTKVDVQEGKVLLTGTSANIGEKELAEFYTKEVEGVKSVQNSIVVVPEKQDATTVVDDASITAQIKYALQSHRSTSAYSTRIVTNDGDVVLSGEAETAAERKLVEELARRVRGVKSVKNNMTVKI